MLRCEVTHSLPLFWAAGTGFATVEVRRVVVTRIRGCGKGLPQKHLLFCRSKMGVLRQRLSLLRPFCVAVGVVTEFRPVSLRFYFETTLLRREILPVCERSYRMQTLYGVTLWR